MSIAWMHIGHGTPLQYPHTNFKHTLDLGPNQMQYLHFKLKHTLDLGSNQMQY
jgi:hypothetical protein